MYSVASLFVIYLGVNWNGSYTKYLTERSQRKAFLETRRSLETRFKTQQENERQAITTSITSSLFTDRNWEACRKNNEILPIILRFLFSIFNIQCENGK